MNQSSSANGKKISSPDSSEVFDTSPSKTYHEQAYIDQTLRLREILKTLPAFAKDYFRAVEPTTSARTRISYAYDIRVFFHFLIKIIQSTSLQFRILNGLILLILKNIRNI